MVQGYKNRIHSNMYDGTINKVREQVSGMLKGCHCILVELSHVLCAGFPRSVYLHSSSKTAAKMQKKSACPLSMSSIAACHGIKKIQQNVWFKKSMLRIG